MRRSEPSGLPHALNPGDSLRFRAPPIDESLPIHCTISSNSHRKTFFAMKKETPKNKSPKKRISNFLAVLGGADTEILEHVDSERNTFIGIGAVMLGTASVASLSMVFAMYNAVLVVSDPSTGQRAQHQPTINLVASIILGILWGVFILVVDRAMIKTMHGVYGLRRAIGYASPRLLLAFIIGLVVSTPLSLQIFRGEIAVQLQQDQTSQIEQTKERNAQLRTGQDLKTAEQNIAGQLAILNGTASTGEINQATQTYNEAVEATKKAQDKADEAYNRWTCEIEPGQALCAENGIGSTGVTGEGVQAYARYQEYEAASAELKAAQDAEEAARNAKNASAQRAREEAHAALCGGASPLEAEASVFSEECSEGYQGEAYELRQKLARENDVESIVRNNSGLLAQIIALKRASFQTWTGTLSHGAIAMLFIIIELLPVGIKTMVAVRGESQYDRVFRKLQESELEKVEAHTAQERDRIDREARRIREIGEDMLQREIDLGKSANEHVAEQMQIILDQTLSHWTERSQTMLAPYLGGVGENAERPADPARPEQAAAPTRPEARPEQPADLGLLPDGSQLAALELGARIGSMGSPSASRDADHFSKRYRALLAIQDEAIRLQREADELAGVGLSAERARLEEMQHELMAAQTAEKEIVADIARHERALAVAERERAELEEQRERLVGQVSEVGAERSRTQDEVNELAEQVQRKTDEINVLEAHHRELKGRLDEANRLFDRLSSLGSAPIPAEAADLLRSIRALAQDLPGEERAPGAGPRQ